MLPGSPAAPEAKKKQGLFKKARHRLSKKQSSGKLAGKHLGSLAAGTASIILPGQAAPAAVQLKADLLAQQQQQLRSAGMIPL